MAAPRIPVAELAEFVASSSLDLEPSGRPRTPLVFVELSGRRGGADCAPATASRSTSVLVGVAADGVAAELHEAADSLDLTLTTHPATHRSVVAVDDLGSSMTAIERAATANPRAVVTLAGLLRTTAVLPVAAGLVAESLAYSMLLAGAEFVQWRASRPIRPAPEPQGPAVLVRRDGGILDVRINRPDRHNAFDRLVRDGLVEAFDLAIADRSIAEIRLAGNGSSFCSGGDLDEFGTTADVTTAHLIRLDRSVAARVHRRREDTHVVVHGACIGAGIEIPSFAAHVHARPDAFFQLPEISMGLVPGAGGTVGITRRIGRWRTAFLALTGERISPQLALEWGLIDGCLDD
jgi:enoyl-CoA hydratase/isomerase-like protein